MKFRQREQAASRDTRGRLKPFGRGFAFVMVLCLNDFVAFGLTLALGYLGWRSEYSPNLPHGLIVLMVGGIIMVHRSVYFKFSAFIPRQDRRLTDSEARCRKCAYILRGIKEPRCPECGERI
jgi:hypothetical protein